MSKIVLQIPLTKYLRDIARTYGGAKYMYVTKTKGGQVWISAEAPGDISGEDSTNRNDIDFDGFYMRLPKDIHQYFELKAGSFKRLDEILKEIKEKEKA
ncbi:hypothetical protein AB8U03_00215 [Clostridium sp. Mt-5]|uniref:Uncharacterized protein n=1 Tax=Clostridium moutaii TaxID=3240932 RepID=A0ABV4BM62_9CLOT